MYEMHTLFAHHPLRHLRNSLTPLGAKTLVSTVFDLVAESLVMLAIGIQQRGCFSGDKAKLFGILMRGRVWV